MYVSFVLSCLCGGTAGTSFNKGSKGIANITAYPIPPGTLYCTFHINSISTIPPGYFATAPTVKIIYLHRNLLTVIEKHMFAGLPDLQDLRLHSNLIHTIQSESFKENTALTRLELHLNFLKTVPESAFDPANHPTALNTFRIYNNPVKCASLCWLKHADWLIVTLPHLIQCTGAGALDGCRWNELTKQDICTVSRLQSF